MTATNCTGADALGLALCTRDDDTKKCTTKRYLSCLHWAGCIFHPHDTPGHGKTFHIPGPLWGESTDQQWIPITQTVVYMGRYFLYDLHWQFVEQQSSYRWYGTPWHLFYIIVKLKFCVPLWVLYLLELAKPTQCRVCICHFDGLVKTTVSPLSIANALEILQSCLNHRFDHIKLWDVIIRFYANFNASSVGLAVLIRHISHGIVFIMTERHQLTLCGYPFILD